MTPAEVAGMTPAEAAAALADGAVPLDLRTPRPFAASHLPGAVNLQFNRADLVDRAEMLLPTDRRYLVHADPDPIARIAGKILSDAGFEVVGHLEGGLVAWEAAGQPTESIDVMDVDTLRDRLAEVQVVDVREGFEYRHAHIAGAVCVPWTQTWEPPGELPDGRTLAIVCGDEVRSAAAASILRRSRYRPALVLGGMVDWLERGYPVEKTKPAAG
jgi:hydroxyacylglutathione hydrolase